MESGDGMSPDVMPHQHVFRFVSHMDGCHWYSTSAACECGAVLHQRAERDVKEDPYSAVWMTDDEFCSRCGELLAGAAPEPFESKVYEAGVR